jgi:hypothetical protein
MNLKFIIFNCTNSNTHVTSPSTVQTSTTGPQRPKLIFCPFEVRLILVFVNWLSKCANVITCVTLRNLNYDLAKNGCECASTLCAHCAALCGKRLQCIATERRTVSKSPFSLLNYKWKIRV